MYGFTELWNILCLVGLLPAILCLIKKQPFPIFLLSAGFLAAGFISYVGNEPPGIAQARSFMFAMLYWILGTVAHLWKHWKEK